MNFNNKKIWSCEIIVNIILTETAFLISCFTIRVIAIWIFLLNKSIIIFVEEWYIFFLFSFQTSFGRGFFELEILEFTNYRGELASGACCGGIPHSQPCRLQCQTFFRVCLKEYQINVTSTGSCSFGNTSSPVLGGNSFTLADPESANGKLVLPFSFSWTVSLLFFF